MDTRGFNLLKQNKSVLGGGAEWGPQGLGFAAVLARTREATPGADAGKWMQMLAVAWLEMLLVGEEPLPPPVGGQIKRAGKDQCKYSDWYLFAGQQQWRWSSKAASSLPQRPTGTLRAPAPMSRCHRHHVATRSSAPLKLSREFCTRP